MRLPRKINVKGQSWKIRYKWNLMHDGDHCRGLCDNDEKTIYLDRMLPKEERLQVLIHELIHAFIFESHFEGITEEIEETLAESLSNYLVDTFNIRYNNPRK